MSLNVHSPALEREQIFFDREALGLTAEDLLIPQDQIERYRRARPSPLNTPKDRLFADALPLLGKRVLDYGCGTGELACELAACGADVTAFDLSPQAVAQSRRRAKLHGLADRIRFDVAQAGRTGYAPANFDVVAGSAVLHHLHTELPAVFAEIDRIVTPHGTAYFIEPVANSPLLRQLRRLVPVKSNATPDERQLLYRDFEPLRSYFPRVEFHHFYCFERLCRLAGRGGSRPLRWLDYQVQRALPWLQRCYGIVLVIARR